MKNKEDQVWTTANVITLLRLLILIPILICIVRGERFWALFWIALSIGSDFADGYVARRWHQKSNFGRILDPLVDKVNTIAVTVALIISGRYEFPIWFFLFVIMREMLVLTCGLFVVKRKNVVMESNRAGKYSAFFTGIAILLFIMRWQPYGKIMIWIVLLLTLYSSWKYLQAFRIQLHPPITETIEDTNPNSTSEHQN